MTDEGDMGILNKEEGSVCDTSLDTLLRTVDTTEGVTP